MFVGRLLRERGVLRGHSAQPELIAKLNHALMLNAHPTCVLSSSSYTCNEC
jgi:hypothetical protein